MENKERQFDNSAAKENVIKRMQGILDRLGIPLSVAWIPDDAKSIHSEISKALSTSTIKQKQTPSPHSRMK
jgi:hypothetical protein